MRLILWRLVQLLFIIGSVLGVFMMLSLNPARCAPNCMDANLAGSTLNGADLSNANFVEARLVGAAMEHVTLSGADLSGAKVTKATLLNADLSNAVLVGVDFSGSDLRGVNLKGANLSGANLSGTNLTGVDLRGAISLHGLSLNEALMTAVQLANTDLSGVEFRKANLTGANLEGANLSGANLSGTNLSGANLRKADLSGAWLNLTDLTGADLTGASLAGATLIGSFLASANFSEANLSGATAIGANFDGADLRNANISGVRFLESDLTDLDILMDPLLAALNEREIRGVIQNARLKGVRFDDTVRWSPDSKEVLETLLGFPLTLLASAETTTVGGVELGPVVPAQQQGAISIVGSAAVKPFTQAIADKFSAAGFPDSITNEVADIGPSFEQLCSGDTVDIVSANRLISDEESAACAALGRTLVGFRIGTDAVVVVVHPSNDFLTNATLEELRQIFTANNWFDVNPRWPRRPVQRFIPANGSVARTFFGDVVNLSAAELDGAGNTIANADLRVLAEALSNNPLSIGFLNYATLRQYIDQLQMIKLAGIAPSYENVETGRYPLAQPLVIYADADLLRRKPQVAAFITFALQKATATSQESGYFPPSAAVLRVSATALLQALTP